MTQATAAAWRPVLDGALAERAVAAALDVADALASDPDYGPAGPDRSLGRGTAGVALLYAALGAALDDPRQTERAVALLDAAIDGVAAATRVDPAFYGATLGVAWAVSRVGTLLGEPDPDESDIDLLVLRLLSAGPWPGHYDLVSGLVGLGAYCVERLPRPAARAALDLVVAQLADTAERRADGVTWLTTPSRYGIRADEYPDGHYDLGMAHGVAGVVAFLSAATRAGVPGARDLLGGGAAWLAAQAATPPDGGGRFPARLSRDGVREPARMAWCYGDPGVSVALLAAGHALGEASLVSLAAGTARGCAEWMDRGGIAEASLCHGSAGAGHIANRIGQALGDDDLLDLARRWFRHALDSRGPDGGVAGFPRHPPLPGHAVGPAAPAFLEGAAGTGLALLAAATAVEPFWDAALFVRATGAWTPA